MPADEDHKAWWRSAVIYQVYPRSFADGNGDGIGDLAGLRARLPYIASLGADAIWISPWYPSSWADGGYDVADYCAIDPVFGTLAEAEQLLAECHALGLRVLLDIVPNHTSDKHPWFREALAGRAGSRQRARYLFRRGKGDHGTEPPNNWPSAFGGSAWHPAGDGEWYLGLFSPAQPDLNWDDEQVRDDFEAILRFWFDRGVDGFRIDVANGLVKDPALPDLPPGWEPGLDVVHPAWGQEAVHEIYRRWRRIGDSYQPQRVFLGEIWAPPESLARYLRPDELQLAFEFGLVLAPCEATALGTAVKQSLAAAKAVGAPSTWTLSNHDLIRPVTRYGRRPGDELADAGAVPSDLRRGHRRARAMALLSLALPGAASIYQGEELGLPEAEDLPVEMLEDPQWEQSGHRKRGRDGCRVPIPWSGGMSPYGFGTGGSWLPQPDSFRELSAEAQSGDACSTLELYRAALRVRRREKALGDGTIRWLAAPEGVLSFARDPDFSCVLNLSAGPFDLPPHSEVLLSSAPLDPAGRLPSDCAAWLTTV